MCWSSSTRAPTRAALPGIQCLVLRMWMVPIPRSDSNTSHATGFSICLQSRTGKELTAVQQNEHMQPPTLIQTSNTSSRICHPCSMYNKRVYKPWNAPAETQFMTPNQISSCKASSPDTPPATRQDPPASFQDSAQPHGPITPGPAALAPPGTTVLQRCPKSGSHCDKQHLQLQSQQLPLTTASCMCILLITVLMTSGGTGEPAMTPERKRKI